MLRLVKCNIFKCNTVTFRFSKTSLVNYSIVFIFVENQASAPSSRGVPLVELFKFCLVISRRDTRLDGASTDDISTKHVLDGAVSDHAEFDDAAIDRGCTRRKVNK